MSVTSLEFGKPLAAAESAPSLWQTLRTGSMIFKTCVAERLAYRGDFALGTLMRFLPIVTQVFLWSAIFSAQPAGHTIKNYNQNDFVAYYLLTMVARAFSSMPGLASSIAGQIRNGEIKKFLIQPVSMLGYLFLSRAAHKAVYFAVATAPFALVFALCRGYFPGWPAGWQLAAGICSLVLSFALGFFLESTLGMIGFWLLEVNSLLFVYMLFNFFFSGHMFPLVMLPDWANAVLQFLPFQFLAYFPAAVLLGKVHGMQLAWGLAVQAVWTLLFFVAAQVAWRKGLVRYSGFGG